MAWRRLQRKRWLKKGRGLPPRVFASLEGTALEERNVRHVFTRMLENANLRAIRVHDLRHTYATLLLQAGALITYVSRQMGRAIRRSRCASTRPGCRISHDGKRIGSTRCNQTQPPRNQRLFLLMSGNRLSR